MVPHAISSGPLRTARTAARAADRPDHFGQLHLATVLYTVTVHTRRMGHNGLHAGGMYWREYNISTRAAYKAQVKSLDLIFVCRPKYIFLTLFL